MKVVVLAGGTSTERDVSLSSGSMIYKALKKNGHQVMMLDVYLGYEGDAEDVFEKDIDWAAQIGSVTEEAPDLEAVKALRRDGGKSFFGPNVLKICQQADAVFMALHGANGEDGKIQAIFEEAGIAYTGSDSKSSAIAMSKAKTEKDSQTCLHVFGWLSLFLSCEAREFRFAKQIETCALLEK